MLRARHFILAKAGEGPGAHEWRETGAAAWWGVCLAQGPSKASLSHLLRGGGRRGESVAGGEAAPAEARGMRSSFPQSHPSLRPCRAPEPSAVCCTVTVTSCRYSQPQTRSGHMWRSRREGRALASGGVACGEESPQTVQPEDQGIPGEGSSPRGHGDYAALRCPESGLPSGLPSCCSCARSGVSLRAPSGQREAMRPLSSGDAGTGSRRGLRLPATREVCSLRTAPDRSWPSARWRRAPWGVRSPR